ncbi:hypothetical protein [Actinomadura nitritigenes]|uniref:hypothetical protein n=1 Tax=Actinomadura nitritigenes TaxID=134602 RepID=UPI003D8BA3C6
MTDLLSVLDRATSLTFGAIEISSAAPYRGWFISRQLGDRFYLREFHRSDKNEWIPSGDDKLTTDNVLWTDITIAMPVAADIAAGRDEDFQQTDDIIDVIDELAAARFGAVEVSMVTPYDAWVVSRQPEGRPYAREFLSARDGQTWTNITDARDPELLWRSVEPALYHAADHAERLAAKAVQAASA